MLFKLYIYILLISLFVCVVGADPSWKEWFAGSVTTSQGVLLVFSGVASRADKYRDIWRACRRHDGVNTNRDLDCFALVQAECVRFGIGLAALGQITGWFKRSNIDTGKNDCVISSGNILMTVVTNFTIGSNGIQKRDGEVGDMINFKAGGSDWMYPVRNLTSLLEGESTIALVGLESNSTKPVMVVEMSPDNGWSITPMTRDDKTKRDGLLSWLYIKGKGSIVLECQYGAGIPITGSIDYFADQYSEYDADNRAHYQYHAFLGSINDNNRMKCAYKQYTYDDTDYSKWRDWNDIWRSFD
ncbi:uncharacterized protein RJT20DRAFT_57640 [Scheffersomyces xylosifermentans]|uniref:uncharacterized protein n=1 Tax=Scheffersomyces xylosifermentans TaxID=1304137 RepID=UPI00315D8765